MYEDCPRGLRITDEWFREVDHRSRKMATNAETRVLVRVGPAVYVFLTTEAAGAYLGVTANSVAAKIRRDSQHPVTLRNAWWHHLLDDGPIPEKYVRMDE